MGVHAIWRTGGSVAGWAWLGLAGCVCMGCLCRGYPSASHPVCLAPRAHTPAGSRFRSLAPVRRDGGNNSHTHTCRYAPPPLPRLQAHTYIFHVQHTNFRSHLANLRATHTYARSGSKYRQVSEQRVCVCVCVCVRACTSHRRTNVCVAHVCAYVCVYRTCGTGAVERFTTRTRSCAAGCRHARAS